jgi:hypothetical protein
VLVTFVGVGATGTRAAELSAEAAELVALVAAAPLSRRTLRLLAVLVADEGRLSAIEYGRVVVDLNPGNLRLRFEDARPQVAVST